MTLQAFADVALAALAEVKRAADLMVSGFADAGLSAAGSVYIRAAVLSQTEFERQYAHQRLRRSRRARRRR